MPLIEIKEKEVFIIKFKPVIKWSGSKRVLSEDIISYFPKEIDTYYELFCGGCSVLFQLLQSDIKVNKFVCNDINSDLINFFNKLKSNPDEIYIEYKKRWNELRSKSDIPEKQAYYNFIRERYNTTHDVFDFIFLSRTSVNGLIRYNSKGGFNAPFHLTRDGIKPDTFKSILNQWYKVLSNVDIVFTNENYCNFNPNENDYMFLDPPYANTKGMYFGTINYEEFWQWLRERKCNYALTFDGKRDEIDNTYAIPKDLYSKHIYLDGKISGFKKLHSDVNYVKESLYIRR